MSQLTANEMHLTTKSEKKLINVITGSKPFSKVLSDDINYRIGNIRFYLYFLDGEKDGLNRFEKISNIVDLVFHFCHLIRLLKIPTDPKLKADIKEYLRNLADEL